jgi:transposase
MRVPHQATTHGTPRHEVIGADGASLLDAIYDAAAPNFLSEIPAVEILRRVWIQNYTWIDGKLRWRSSEDIPPAARYIGSPYDVEAHYSKKRSTTWVGYKVHLTETCEKESPHLPRACGNHLSTGF